MQVIAFAMLKVGREDKTCIWYLMFYIIIIKIQFEVPVTFGCTDIQFNMIYQMFNKNFCHNELLDLGDNTKIFI